MENKYFQQGISCIWFQTSGQYFSKHLNFRCFCYFSAGRKGHRKTSFECWKNIFTTFWKGTCLQLEVRNQILPENKVYSSIQLKIPIKLSFLYKRQPPLLISLTKHLTIHFSYRHGLLIVMVSDSVSCIYSWIFKADFSHNQFTHWLLLYFLNIFVELFTLTAHCESSKGFFFFKTKNNFSCFIVIVLRS